MKDWEQSHSFSILSYTSRMHGREHFSAWIQQRLAACLGAYRTVGALDMAFTTGRQNSSSKARSSAMDDDWFLFGRTMWPLIHRRCGMFRCWLRDYFVLTAHDAIMLCLMQPSGCQPLHLTRDEEEKKKADKKWQAERTKGWLFIGDIDLLARVI